MFAAMKAGHFEAGERMFLQTTQLPSRNIISAICWPGGIIGRPIHCVVFHGEAFDRFRFVRRSIEFCTGKLSICTEKHRIFHAAEAFDSYEEISNFPRRSIRFVRRSIEFSTEKLNFCTEKLRMFVWSNRFCAEQR